MSLENFKNFVRERPKLNEAVENNEKSWQEFYNMFELYGPDSSVWDRYNNAAAKGVASALGAFSLAELFGMFKNINMSDLQRGIGSVQKGIGYLQSLSTDKREDKTENKSSYESRPVHKYFDD